VCFWFSLQLVDYIVLALFAYVVLALVSSVLCQEIGGEERVRNDLFCVKWELKPIKSINLPVLDQNAVLPGLHELLSCTVTSLVLTEAQHW